MQKLPYLIVVGEKEKAARQVAVRLRGGQDLGQMALDALVARMMSEREQRGPA